MEPLDLSTTTRIKPKEAHSNIKIPAQSDHTQVLNLSMKSTGENSPREGEQGSPIPSPLPPQSAYIYDTQASPSSMTSSVTMESVYSHDDKPKRARKKSWRQVGVCITFRSFAKHSNTINQSITKQRY
jgi:hypothetical protein